MKKKVLFIQPSLLMGGTETILIHYLNMLSESERYEVSVLFLETNQNFNIDKINPKVRQDFILSKAESQFNIYCIGTLAKQFYGNASEYYYHSWATHLENLINERTCAYLNEHNFDLIISFQHTGTASFDNFLRYYDVNSRIPILRWVYQYPQIVAWANNWEKDKVYLNKYHSFITICEEMTADLQHLFEKLHLEKTIHFLYNPVDIPAIQNLAQEKLQDLPINIENENYFVAVSRLDDSHKNLIQLINIYKKLRERGVTEKLLLVGDGKDYAKIEAHIKQLGLENDCLLAGARTNPFPLMKNAKLFLHTAHYEGLPTVFIESMACGTPVVAMQCPTGPKDILANGKYGELVPLYDEDAFVEKVCALLQDHDRYQHFVNLLPEAVERFRFETIKHKTEQIFDEMIAKLNH